MKLSLSTPSFGDFRGQDTPPLCSSPHHHGNLAHAIVEAALALLDETQDWDFSLREVARRAGVSHNAPYKHFPEKRDLLAAVAARGFEALAERMLCSLQGLTDPWAGLLACGRAFVAHGVANPALYRLMFSAALTSPEAGRPLIEKLAAAKARSIFEAAVADAVGSGYFLRAWQTRAKARRRRWPRGPCCTGLPC